MERRNINRKAKGNVEKKQITLSDVENMFINKLSEKYRFTERDLSRAFKRFDVDGSGNVSLGELTKAIGLFVQGVDPQLVAELVSVYDVDGDGEISLEEFSQFVMSRNSPNKEDWLTVDKLLSTVAVNKDSQLYTVSNESMIKNLRINSKNSEESADHDSRIFLQNLKSTLLKKVMDMRLQGKIPVTDRMSYHTSELAENFARNMISDAFRPYASRGGSSHAHRIDFNAFSIVMQKLVPPGGLVPSQEVLKCLFNKCATTENIGGSDNNRRIDPDVMIDMLFEKNVSRINKFGFAQPLQAASETRRPDVGIGPLTEAPATTTGSDNKLMLQSGKLKISDIPFRFITKRCKTSLAAPSNFRVEMLHRSNSIPEYTFKRNFAHGLNCLQLYSGSALKYLVTPLFGNSSTEGNKTIVYVTAALGIVYDVCAHTQYFFDGHDDDITCFTVSQPISWPTTSYTSALMVNMSPAEQQRLLSEPKTRRQLAASGQMGKTPCIHVWETWPTSSSSSTTGQSLKLITKIGGKFFRRGVCAVEFSPDAKYVCGISCDDKHSIGIWNLGTGELIAENVTYPGIPPAVRYLSWSTIPNQDTSYISKNEQSREATTTDVLCTAGERHIKFWTFNRPTSTSANTSSAKLLCKMGRYGSKLQNNSPSMYLCVAFLDDYSADAQLSSVAVVAGASNGSLYVFSEGICNMIVPIFGFSKSTANNASNVRNCGVCCLQAMGDKIICGGSTGEIVVVSCSNNFKVVYRLQVSTSSPPTTSISSDDGQRLSARPASATMNRTNNIFGGEDATVRRESTTASHKGGSGITPKNAWGGPQEPNKIQPLPEGTLKAACSVVGFCICTDHTSRRPNINELIVCTGFGKSMIVNLDSNEVNTMLYYHYGPVWAVATHQHMIVSGGDDKYLYLWDNKTNMLKSRTKSFAPIRCCCFGANTSDGEVYLAVGTAGGAVALYVVSNAGSRSSSGAKSSLSRPDNSPKSVLEARNRQNNSSFSPPLTLLCRRRDCQEDISEVKFSPNARMLAVGSHDNFIDIYMVTLGDESRSNRSSAAPSGSTKGKNKDASIWRYIKRLRGHSSFVTHLDWSYDNRIIRSTCGAYELLYWDVAGGKQMLSSTDTTESDTVWATNNCVLGFDVMGIWRPSSNGDDINAIDVDINKGIVVTADDYGNVKCFNFPCVVKNPPCHTFKGHSSHVMNVKTIQQGGGGYQVSGRRCYDGGIVSVGANDNTIISWSVDKT